MHPPVRQLAAAVVAVLALSAVSGCGSNDDDASSATTAATTSAPPTTAAAEAGCTTASTGPLQVVLANNDGLSDPSIDPLIDALKVGEVAVNVTVIAPTEATGGTSDSTTPGQVDATRSATPGGNVAYAVEGFAGDAVSVAVEQLELNPHLVVAGINRGQVAGPNAAVSGTIGAARAAIRAGLPALAVSAGIDFDEVQFQKAAELALDWITDNCQALMDRSFQTDTLASIVVPTCTPEQMGELVEVPWTDEPAEGDDAFNSRCDLADPDPANDMAAVASGYPSLSQLPADL